MSTTYGLPDPKPAPRIKDAKAGRAKLKREGSKCRACGGRHLVSRHHIVPKSQRGDDVDDNLVPLCELCHGALHRDDDRGIRMRVRRALTPAEIDYVTGKAGPEWLERRYPLGPCS